MPSKLGQNFLINKKALEAIAKALEIKDGETIVEIGPGHGELTEILATETDDKIIAIEKDGELAGFLRRKFSDNDKIEIINGDALKVLPQIPKSYILNSKSYKVVGNIPYYITGYLLRILSELENKPSLAVLTIQKEVAERLVAKPPRMNLLAAAVQFWSEPKIIGELPKEYFNPKPKVDSAIIKLKTIYPQQKSLSREKYYRLIKIIFKQPRKTILNNLQAGLPARAGLKLPKEEILKILAEENVQPTDRPQDLSVGQIKKLAEKFLN